MKGIKVLLVFCLLLITVVEIRADSRTLRVGKLVEIEGDVTIKKGLGIRSFQAFVGMSLTEGDTIQTGPKSSTVLRMEDGDEIHVYEKSKLHISELMKEKNKKRSVFQLWVGKAWVKAGKLLNVDSVFEVRTPSTVIGIRGTQFFVKSSPEEGTTTGVVEGKISVLTLSKDPTVLGREKILYPFEQVRVPSDGSTYEIQPIQNMDEWEENIGDILFSNIRPGSIPSDGSFPNLEQMPTIIPEIIYENGQLSYVLKIRNTDDFKRGAFLIPYDRMNMLWEGSRLDGIPPTLTDMVNQSAHIVKQGDQDYIQFSVFMNEENPALFDINELRLFFTFTINQGADLSQIQPFPAQMFGSDGQSIPYYEYDSINP